MLKVYANYDGPLYIVPAKTSYNPDQISNLKLESSLDAKYFAAHLPLYPAFIKIFSPLMGYLKSMIFVNVLFTVVLALFFFYLLKKFKITVNPLLLVTVFLLLPRFLIVRSVGAPESLFMLLILVSVFFFEKEKYLLAGLFGGLAVMTKTPGLLLFFAYFLVFIEKAIRERNWRLGGFGRLGIFLIPLGLIGVFGLYAVQYNDFLAYFRTGGFVPLVSPFSVFNFQKLWVGTAWLEDIIFYFFLYLITVLTLKDSKYRSFFYFSLVFLTATTFVQHRDIARYSLPLWPFACIALEKFFTSKKFAIALLILLPAIFFYGWNFLIYNVMPIADWTPFR